MSGRLIGSRGAPDPRKLAYIDALRGYAVAAVLLLHSSQGLAPGHPAFAWLADRGELGVQLFYLASAVTLLMSWDFRTAREAAPIRNFFIRRFFRIAPMFYIAIAYYSIETGGAAWFWAPNGVKWYFAGLTALFLHGFHPETINSVVPGGWSVAVEMTFYLFLPLFAARIRSPARAAGFLALSVAIAYAGRAAWIWAYSGLYPHEQQYLVVGSAYYSFPSQLPVFALGILAYSIIADRAALARRVAIGNAALLAVSTLAAAAVMLGWLPLQTVLHAAANYLVASVVLALAIVTLAYRPSAIVCNGVMTFLGKISFSMYLVQFALIDLFAATGITGQFPHGDLGTLLYFVCLSTSTAAVSYACYRLVETPGIAWGKRLIARLEQARKTPVESDAPALPVQPIKSDAAAS